MKFSSVASAACIIAGVGAFQYPDFVPLNKRQQPGTPQYECHANCGGVITSSRSNDFCNSSDFKSGFNVCLECALEYDIWKYYGNAVSEAGDECGLDATPVELSSSTTISASDTSSTAASSSTSSTAEAKTTEIPTATTESTESTIEVTEAAPSSTFVTSTPVIPTVTSSPTMPGSLTSPRPSSPVFTGAAALNMPAGPLMGGFIGPIVAALI